MKRKFMFWVTFAFAIFLATSCVFNKNATRKANEFNKSMTEIRDKVYSSVVSVKNDKSIDASSITLLKKQYSTLQESFNKSFDNILKSVDSNALDKTKCALLNFKRVMTPYQGDFENSAKLANDFNTAVLKETNVSAIGVSDILSIVIDIFKSLAKERIKVCKENIEEMKYKDWDDIQQAK